MATDPGPFDLETTRLVLGPGGDATPKHVGPNFYQELDDEFDGFAGHVLVSKHAFDEAWGSWERHPRGDEIVYLLFGAVDLVLWVDGAEQVVTVREPGSCVVVPKGTWHTARPHVPTGMLFITPGEGTEIAEKPASD